MMEERELFGHLDREDRLAEQKSPNWGSAWQGHRCPEVDVCGDASVWETLAGEDRAVTDPLRRSRPQILTSKPTEAGLHSPLPV